MAPRAQGADPSTAHLFRYPPTARGALVAIAVLVYWWDIYVMGLRFLAQPAVTSASEVLSQTYRSPVRERQTSGVLRHTERVRDDDVQEQDWRHARPRGDITAQSHSVSAGQSVCDIQVRTLRTVVDARSNVSDGSSRSVSSFRPDGMVRTLRR